MCDMSGGVCHKDNTLRYPAVLGQRSRVDMIRYMVSGGQLWHSLDRNIGCASTANHGKCSLRSTCHHPIIAGSAIGAHQRQAAGAQLHQ